MSISSLEQKIDRLVHRITEIERHLDSLEYSLKDLSASKTKEIGTSLPPDSPPRKRIIAKKIAGVVVWFATLLGILAGYTSLRYDVSVANLSTLNPSLPYESRFLVTNTGPFSIYNVTYVCRSVHIHMSGMPELAAEITVPIPLPELRANGAYSAHCTLNGFETRAIENGAILQIEVKYTPRFLFWVHKEGGQQFALKIDNQGHAVWLPSGNFYPGHSELMQREWVSPP